MVNPISWHAGYGENLFLQASPFSKLIACWTLILAHTLTIILILILKEG